MTKLEEYNDKRNRLLQEYVTNQNALSKEYVTGRNALLKECKAKTHALLKGYETEMNLVSKEHKPIHRAQLILMSETMSREELAIILRDTASTINRQQEYKGNEVETLVIDDMEDE